MSCDITVLTLYQIFQTLCSGYCYCLLISDPGVILSFVEPVRSGHGWGTGSEEERVQSSGHAAGSSPGPSPATHAQHRGGESCIFICHRPPRFSDLHYYSGSWVLLDNHNTSYKRWISHLFFIGRVENKKNNTLYCPSYSLMTRLWWLPLGTHACFRLWMYLHPHFQNNILCFCRYKVHTINMAHRLISVHAAEDSGPRWKCFPGSLWVLAHSGGAAGV